MGNETESVLFSHAKVASSEGKMHETSKEKETKLETLSGENTRILGET